MELKLKSFLRPPQTSFDVFSKLKFSLLLHFGFTPFTHRIFPSPFSFSRFSFNRNSLHRRLLDGSPRMLTLNATSPNESQTMVDGPMSLGASTNGENSLLPSGTSSLVLRRPSANMFVVDFRFPLSFLCCRNLVLININTLFVFCDVIDEFTLCSGQLIRMAFVLIVGTRIFLILTSETSFSNFYRNPSSGSIQMSETGSLDRMKAQAERRKKVLDDAPNVTGRVENTRVNPDKTIDELLRNSKLDQLEEATERELGKFGERSWCFVLNY